MNGHFADNVVHFARALRGAGLPVGPAAVIDAAAAVETVGIERRDDLYWTLHAVLVTRHDESAVFGEVFRAFWRARGLRDRPGAAQLGPAGAPPHETSRPPPASRRAQGALHPSPAEPRPAETAVETALPLTPSDAARLRTRDFAQMSADEIRAARRLIARLAMPDDRRPTRRLRADRRGRSIDVRATLRGSLRTGGDAFALAFRAPARRLPPVVALLDISGSMADYSRLFLHFLHALGDTGRTVHTFVFATGLTNVTRDLTRRDPDEALARAAGRVRDWEGGTRIAAALGAFNRDWSRRVLGGRATVLLFSDGLERDTGDALAFEADRLHRSCARLVWLNPLLRFAGFEPRAAGIRTLLAHVDAFRPIHDLRSMEQLVEALSGPERRRPGPGRAIRPRPPMPGAA